MGIDRMPVGYLQCFDKIHINFLIGYFRNRSSEYSKSCLIVAVRIDDKRFGRNLSV